MEPSKESKESLSNHNLTYNKEVVVKSQGFVAKKGGKIRDHYRIGKLLGSGAFGEVRLCLHKETQS
jgi:serine/threonine protein kinase